MTDGQKRRESDKSFVRRLSPGNWIQIGLLLLAIIGGYFNFEWRILNLEKFDQDTKVRMELLESKEMVQAQLQAYRENMNTQLVDIRERLGRIERKLDRGDYHVARGSTVP